MAPPRTPEPLHTPTRTIAESIAAATLGECLSANQHQMVINAVTEALDRERNAHAGLIELAQKVVLFGENQPSLSIGTEAALSELARNARAALRAAGEE